MRLNDKTGFTLLESLVGFMLFSLMLLFYIPSFQLELMRMSELRAATLRWQTFYDLVRIVEQDDDYRELLDGRIVTAPEAIQSFACEIDGCWIIFEGGEYYEVKILSIE